MSVDLSVLLQPLRVGGVTLPNRFVMGSMHTGLEAHPERWEELARFYSERARRGVGMMVTGGFAPCAAGRLQDVAGTLERPDQVAPHRVITRAVRDAGGRILLQLLHAGRYGYHADIVAPSPIRAPINRTAPRELGEAEIVDTIASYANAARLALEAGYHGVEVMGSEGYLISQFLAQRTNLRTDHWGGPLASRARFPLAVVRAVREAMGEGPILSYRISALELVEGGLSDDETVWLAREIETAGADCLMTGIGWHEAIVPTIGGVVPHAGFASATRRLRAAVSIPVIASNRINLPETGARLIAEGTADLVSMARPFLADAAFVEKVKAGTADRVNVCIACNQACLDHYFTHEVISCLVNPRALREGQFTDAPAARRKRVAVIGAGVAGMAAALEAGRRGHDVTLYEAAPGIGGQLRLAAQVPGKEDYGLFLDHYRRQLEAAGVTIRAGVPVSIETLAKAGHDEVVISTGIVARALDIPGSDDPRVVGYAAVLDGTAKAGDRVVVIGGGGIGHDVALYLAGGTGHRATVEEFEKRWGIGRPAELHPAQRRITMVKRSPGAFGRTLGRTTGWIVRQELKDFGVRQIAGARYLKIDAAGLHIEVDGKAEVVPADTIVVCAGQEPTRELADRLEAQGRKVHVIGGARLAAELDAKRAMLEGALVGNAM